MRLQNLGSTAALSLTAVVLISGSIVGQFLEPLQQNQTQKNQSQSLAPLTSKSAASHESQQPYKLSSRFHLQQGTDSGYLVVKMEMPKGSYIYSMTQAAPLRPSKIDVTQSSQFRVVGEFSPDRPATVVENDPIFKQRLEKHVDVVQFFVPIKIAPNVDVTKLSAEITYSGQVCTERGTCMPVSKVKARGKFAGYFERKTQQRTPSPNQAPNGNPIR